MRSKILVRLLFGGAMLIAAGAVSPVRAAEKDIFDYKAQHASCAGEDETDRVHRGDGQPRVARQS